MMNTPSMYSVDQLLKARQNGVPDYVVVPMLQKAMAQKASDGAATSVATRCT